MSEIIKKPAASDNADSTETVLDLKGSDLHHDLKNQPGEKGDPNHTKDDDNDSDT